MGKVRTAQDTVEVLTTGILSGPGHPLAIKSHLSTVFNEALASERKGEDVIVCQSPYSGVPDGASAILGRPRWAYMGLKGVWDVHDAAQGTVAVLPPPGLSARPGQLTGEPPSPGQATRGNRGKRPRARNITGKGRPGRAPIRCEANPGDCSHEPTQAVRRNPTRGGRPKRARSPTPSMGQAGSREEGTDEGADGLRSGRRGPLRKPATTRAVSAVLLSRPGECWCCAGFGMAVNSWALI